jgi:hypothetical protein
MPWHCVYIPSQASSKVSAWTLVQMAREVHKKSGESQDVAIYHAFTDDGHNLFYFSPASVAVFDDLLKFFGASPREKPRFVETFTPVLGPGAPLADEWWVNGSTPQNASGNQEAADNGPK